MRADKVQVSRLLKTARGQIDGILRMIEKDEYCIDISNQIMACEAVLHKTNKVVIRAHLEGCVADAFAEGDEEKRQEKIDELIAIMEKLAK